jgi:hypothetical protein
MKISTLLSLSIVAIVVASGFTSSSQDGNIEFYCMKTHKASNTCYFNFKVDGAKFKYVDMGCKFAKKKEEAIEKVKDGTLALSKDWKIDCPEPTEKKDTLRTTRDISY